MITIEWEKLHDDAIIPKQQNIGDGCFDFHCIENGIIQSKKSAIIRSGLAMQMIDIDKVIEYGWILRAYPRSGLGFKNDILIHIGTIDCGYRGEIKIKLFNFGDNEFVYNKGDRLIQLAVEKVYNVDHRQVFYLEGSERGKNGFGSSGK